MARHQKELNQYQQAMDLSPIAAAAAAVQDTGLAVGRAISQQLPLNQEKVRG